MVNIKLIYIFIKYNILKSNIFKLFIDEDYRRSLKTGRPRRRNQQFRCPYKNFNKPRSFKLRSIMNTNLNKPYNEKFAKRMYNNLYIRNALKCMDN